MLERAMMIVRIVTEIEDGLGERLLHKLRAF